MLELRTEGARVDISDRRLESLVYIAFGLKRDAADAKARSGTFDAPGLLGVLPALPAGCIGL